MPRIDLDALPPSNATGYPPPFDAAVAGRWYRRIGAAAGLRDFAASHVVLEPGAWSSQRHWHDDEDELLVMIAGTATLIEDAGETRLVPGDIAVWPKGSGDGHHLRNDGDAPCTFLCIGGGANRRIDGAMRGGGYSDIDMLFTGDGRYTRKDGTPYAAERV